MDHGLTKGSPALHPSSLRKNWITAWKRFETVTLKKFCFIIGAFPTALKRTTTAERVGGGGGGFRMNGLHTRRRHYYLPFAGSFFLYDSRAARPSARPASAAGSGAVKWVDKYGIASGVSAMQNTTLAWIDSLFFISSLSLFQC
jgi:hypothetical protein